MPRGFPSSLFAPQHFGVAKDFCGWGEKNSGVKRAEESRNQQKRGRLMHSSTQRKRLTTPAEYREFAGSPPDDVAIQLQRKKKRFAGNHGCCQTERPSPKKKKPKNLQREEKGGKTAGGVKNKPDPTCTQFKKKNLLPQK